jgi:fumarate hydratase class II
MENFAFGISERMPLAIVRALAGIKQVAADINRRHGLDSHLAEAIMGRPRKSEVGKWTPNSLWPYGKPGPAPRRT